MTEPGYEVYVADEGKFYRFDGREWGISVEESGASWEANRHLFATCGTTVQEWAEGIQRGFQAIKEGL